MGPERAILNSWTGAAPAWEKHRNVIRQMFAPVTQALVEDASLGHGQAVLDIATGPGEPGLSMAPIVGRQGRIIGLDPVPEMVAAARRARDRLDVKNAQFCVASAQELPFPAGTFDAVVSRFGIMFVPCPVDAVREMLRVLKPARNLALAVWNVEATNPFFGTLSRTFAQYLESPPAAPDAPDAYRFAQPGKLRGVFVDAGAAATSERLFQFRIEAPISAEEFWNVRFEMSEKLREKAARLSTKELAEVKRQSIETVRQYSTDRGLSFPAEVLIVSGTKSPFLLHSR